MVREYTWFNLNPFKFNLNIKFKLNLIYSPKYSLTLWQFFVHLEWKRIWKDDAGWNASWLSISSNWVVELFKFYLSIFILKYLFWLILCLLFLWVIKGGVIQFTVTIVYQVLHHVLFGANFLEFYVFLMTSYFCYEVSFFTSRNVSCSEICLG